MAAFGDWTNNAYTFNYDQMSTSATIPLYYGGASGYVMPPQQPYAVVPLEPVPEPEVEEGDLAWLRDQVEEIRSLAWAA
jgi:hypothetical protein